MIEFINATDTPEHGPSEAMSTMFQQKQVDHKSWEKRILYPLICSAFLDRFDNICNTSATNFSFPEIFIAPKQPIGINHVMIFSLR